MDLTLDLPRYSGKDATELVALLKKHRDDHVNYLVGPESEAGKLRMELLPFVDDSGVRNVPGIVFEGPDGKRIEAVPTNNCQGHLCDRTFGVRKAYEKLARDLPDVLPTIVNHYMNLIGKRRLLRLVRDGEGKPYVLRGYLSEKYRLVDNVDLALTALEGAKLAAEEQGIPLPRVRNWSVSETRFSLNLWNPHVWADYKETRDSNGGAHDGLPFSPGPWLDNQERVSIADQGGRDVVFAGLSCGNSETGDGCYDISAYGYRLVCSNGQTRGRKLAAIRQNHIHGGYEDERLLLRPETIQKKNAVLFDEIRDAVSSTFTREKFEELVDSIRTLRARDIRPPEEAVDLLVERTRLTEDAEKAILAAYTQEVDAGRNTAFDLYQAVTAVARDTENDDFRDELEKAAVAVLDDARLEKQLVIVR